MALRCSKSTGVCIVWLLVLTAALAAAEPKSVKAPPVRTWTDASGKFKIEAALVELQDDAVSLRKKDGTVLSVPIEKLSAADQRYLKAHGGSKTSDEPAAELPPATKAEEAASQTLYQQIAEAYLGGKWDDLEKTLHLSARQLAGLTAEQRTEVAAVRRAVAEGRPAWWPACKAGQKGLIRPLVWGRTLDLTYDPAGKGGVQMQFTGGAMSLSVSWPAAEMDNPDHAEHGFSKGELNDLGIWATLGMALTWSQTPPQALVNLSQQDQLRLTRYLDFRGNVTGLYYGEPRARRWGEFLYLLTWKEKYAKMPTVNCRKAAGAMFLAEVLANPGRYPSLPLPTAAPTENAEEKLAEHYRNHIEKHGWTVAEDLALREALKSFATANDATVMQTQRAVLPNKLTVALDPEVDAALRPKRDAWLAAQCAKAIEQK